MRLATAQTLALAAAFAALGAQGQTVDPDQGWRDLVARQRREDDRETMRQANPKAPSVRAKKRQARRRAWA